MTDNKAQTLASSINLSAELRAGQQFNLLNLKVQLNYGTNIMFQKDPSRGVLTWKPA